MPVRPIPLIANDRRGGTIPLRRALDPVDPPADIDVLMIARYGKTAFA